jgi:hypothetical protein
MSNGMAAAIGIGTLISGLLIYGLLPKPDGTPGFLWFDDE